MPAEKKPVAKKAPAKKTAVKKAPAKKAVAAKPAKPAEPTALIGAVTPPAPEVHRAPAKKQGFFTKLFGKKS